MWAEPCARRARGQLRTMEKPGNREEAVEKSGKSKNLLSAIDEKKVILDTLRPFTQGELERLSEQFVTEYTYNSNAIEGNTLTLRETDLVLRGLTIDKKPLAHHLEAIGHKEAFSYVADLARKNEPLSERVIKDIHH